MFDFTDGNNKRFVTFRTRRGFHQSGPNTFNHFAASDPSELFIQMAPTVRFDNHVIPAHMVGAYEKSPSPSVISLPPVPLGSGSLQGGGLTLNGHNFESQLNHYSSLRKPELVALNAVNVGQEKFKANQEYTGKAQVVDLELQNPSVRSAMQHAGEGDHEDGISDSDKPYNNLQDSHEQHQAGHTFPVKSNDDILREDVVHHKRSESTNIRKVPAAVYDLSESVAPPSYERVIRQKPLKKSRKDHYDEMEEEMPPRRRKKKTKVSPPPQDDDGSAEESPGRGLFNIQFGGGRKSISRSRKRKPRPPESEELNGDEEEEPAEESRRSLLRMPFRVFRGVSLNRGDDGALAFNINLG